MENLSLRESQELAEFLRLSYNIGFYFQTQLDTQLTLCSVIMMLGLLLESSLGC